MVGRSALSVKVNLTMRLVELLSYATSLMLLQPSLSPITWEAHKAGRKRSIAVISWEGIERQV